MPLSEPALQLLHAVPRFNNVKLVFPSTRRESRLSSSCDQGRLDVDFRANVSAVRRGRFMSATTRLIYIGVDRHPEGRR